MNWIVKEIIRVGRLLFKEGLVSARAGNISRVFEDKLFITRTGALTGSLSEEDIIQVPLWNSSILDRRASVELIVHRKVIIETGKRAVVHAHPVHAVALSLSRDVIEPVDSEGKEIIGSVPVVEVEKPSASEELAQAIAEALRISKVVIVKGHGAFSADEQLVKAYSYISTLEHSCKILACVEGR